MKKPTSVLLFSLAVLMSFSPADHIYVGTGNALFTSSAPLEKISASSGELKGIIDLSNNSFAFSLPVSSFKGFNSSLQKEHFNENYLETSRYPKSTFEGKILDFKGCEADCEIEIIAKGKLTIHGITQVVMLPARIRMKEKNLSVTSDFNIQLSDFGIEIPLILEGKISPFINVSVNAVFIKKSD